MANSLYTKAKEGILSGSLNWATDNVKVCLVDTSAYTVNLSTNTYLNDIPSAARIATSAVLSGRTWTNGIADADDVTFAAVSGATSSENLNIVLFSDTGTASSSRLIAYFDTGTGLPVTTNGGEVDITWPNDGNGIFRL